MSSVMVCERCGLKAVRREFERRGVVYRFCDDCYWGELEAERPVGGNAAAKEAGPPPSGGKQQ